MLENTTWLEEGWEPLMRELLTDDGFEQHVRPILDNHNEQVRFCRDYADGRDMDFNIVWECIGRRDKCVVPGGLYIRIHERVPISDGMVRMSIERLVKSLLGHNGFRETIEDEKRGRFFGEVWIDPELLSDEDFMTYVRKAAEHNNSKTLCTRAAREIKSASPERIRELASTNDFDALCKACASEGIPQLQEDQAVAYVLGCLDGNYEVSKSIAPSDHTRAQALLQFLEERGSANPKLYDNELKRVLELMPRERLCVSGSRLSNLFYRATPEFIQSFGSVVVQVGDSDNRYEHLPWRLFLNRMLNIRPDLEVVVASGSSKDCRQKAEDEINSDFNALTKANVLRGDLPASCLDRKLPYIEVGPCQELPVLSLVK